MTLKPRQSVLDLFDPLLSHASLVPLPDSPPQTPGCPDDEKSQESRFPDDLMALFFDHFSERKGALPSRTQTSGRLVDIEEEDIGESEFIGIEPFQHDAQSPTTENEPSVDISASPCAEKTNKPENIELPIPILVCPDTTIHPESLTPTSQTSFTENEKVMSCAIGYLNPPSQSRDRRRSSIDISMSLSSFSSSVQELPGSNADLIKEELFPLSVFSEEDSFQFLDEIGTCPLSLQGAQETTALVTPHRPTDFGQNSQKKTKELDDQKTETPSHKKEHSRTLPIKGSYRTEMTPTRLKDTSNSQTTVKGLKMSYKEPAYTASPHFDIVIPAPRKPKIFTLNRYQSLKPHTSLQGAANKNDDTEDSIPTIPSKVLPRPPLDNRSTGSAPGKTIPRLQKVPIVKHATALESKIPSRTTAVPSESTNQSQAKVSATIKTFGGPSRIAVPLKKGVRRTAS